MNWDAIGAVGEIIGALAVVVSLLYLAAQVRTQNAQAKLAALHDMGREFRSATVLFAGEDLSDIFTRANADFDSITDAEAVRLIVATTNLFRAWEEAFLEMRDGHLGEGVWEALSRDYTQPFGAPCFRHIWSLRKQNYDPGFQEFVESLQSQEYIVR